MSPRVVRVKRTTRIYKLGAFYFFTVTRYATPVERVAVPRELPIMLVRRLAGGAS